MVETMAGIQSLVEQNENNNIHNKKDSKLFMYKKLIPEMVTH